MGNQVDADRQPGSFYITNTWIAAHASLDGRGWTAGQLRVLGVPWPPPKGWRRKLIGTAISDEARIGFEAIGRERRTRLTKRVGP